MYHFFAKLGRKPYSKAILPCACMFVSTGYLSYHLLGHNLARNLLGAELETGRRSDIPRDLQRLILSVYEDVQSDFNKPLLPVSFWKVQVPTIKWFSSASIEPVTIGITESNFGVTIGLPNHYNYDKLEDLPRSLLEVRKFSLFKSFRGDKSQEKRKDTQEELGEDCENCETGKAGELIHIDPESEHGIKYLESFVLSEKAKRFSIARELFVVDSYKPLVTTALMFSTSLLSVLLSRAVVSRFGYLNAHLSQRLPFYALSAAANLYLFYNFIDTTNQFYTKSADTRALNLGETYREGAVEYFTKAIQRHKTLRTIFEDYKNVYDEDGNVINPLFRTRNIPLTERLEVAEKFKFEVAAEN